MGLAGHTPGGTDGVRGGAGSGALGTGTGAGSGLRTGRETRPLGEGEGSQQSALSSGHVPGTALYAGDTDGCPPMGARRWVPADGCPPMGARGDFPAWALPLLLHRRQVSSGRRVQA